MKLYLHIGIPKQAQRVFSIFAEECISVVSSGGSHLSFCGQPMSPGTIAAAVGNPHVLSLYADNPHFPATA